MTATVLFLGLVVLLILNVPVGIAIGLACVVPILTFGTLSELYVAQTLVSATDSFPIMAIPLFILAGDLMGAGGVSRRILGVASAFFGRFTGGLAIVTVVVCMFFAAVSGSGPATAVIASIIWRIESLWPGMIMVRLWPRSLASISAPRMRFSTQSRGLR